MLGAGNGLKLGRTFSQTFLIYYQMVLSRFCLLASLVMGLSAQAQFGCTDFIACNYDGTATVDDGSCEYPGCTDPSACNFDPSALCEGLQACFFGESPELDCDCVEDLYPAGIDEYDYGNMIDQGAIGNNGNLVPSELCPTSFFAASFGGINSTVTVEYGCHRSSAVFVINGGLGCTYDLYISNGVTTFYLNQSGGFNGTVNLHYDPSTTTIIDNTNSNQTVFSFTDSVPDCSGCTDSGACNFDPLVVFPGVQACFYGQSPELDCDCVEDLFPAGIDEYDYGNMIDQGAIGNNGNLVPSELCPTSYFAAATGGLNSTVTVEYGCDRSSAVFEINGGIDCTYHVYISKAVGTFYLNQSGGFNGTVNMYYDPLFTTIIDNTNGQQTVQSFSSPVFPCLGCTYTHACNYDAVAEVDDASCILRDACGHCGGSGTVSGCTDALADNYLPEADCDDGSCVLSGCSYPSASNYDPAATHDDLSCVFTAACAEDLDGGGDIGTGDLLQLLGVYGTLCPASLSE